jgi:hypothetical protein
MNPASCGTIARLEETEGVWIMAIKNLPFYAPYLDD